MKASLNAHHGLVKTLLVAGADVNARDSQGQTVLHYAVRGRHAGIIRLVCLQRVDTRATSRTSQMQVCYKEKRSNFDIVFLDLDISVIFHIF